MNPAPIISLAERRAQRAQDAFLEAALSIYSVVPIETCGTLSQLLLRLSQQVGHVAGIIKPLDQRTHAVMIYVYARRCWEAMGLGSAPAFDRAVQEQGGDAAGHPPDANVTWWIGLLVDAVGEVGALYTAWWGAEVDDFADNLADHLVLLGAKMRCWWESTKGE